jgi:hypothetical protein
MAVTVIWFAKALSAIMNKEVDLLDDTIKLLLTTSSYSPNYDAHDYKDDVTSEVSGTGYTAGGLTLASKTFAYTAANSWGRVHATSTAHTLGQIVRPSTGNGHLYICTVAGTSGGSAPTWPTVSGQTVTDGGVTWTELGIGLFVFDATDPQWSASTITARRAVAYDATPGTDAARPLLLCIDFGEDVVSSNGNFTITLPQYEGMGWIAVRGA